MKEVVGGCSCRLNRDQGREEMKEVVGGCSCRLNRDQGSNDLQVIGRLSESFKMSRVIIE
jgi:hypothetical protein